MNGLDHLRNARQALCSGCGDPRDALHVAAAEFWQAVFYATGWPADLRQQAEAVFPCILLHGTIDRTVAALDEPGVEEARRKIDEFCTLAQARLSEPQAAAGLTSPPLAG